MLRRPGPALRARWPETRVETSFTRSDLVAQAAAASRLSPDAIDGLRLSASRERTGLVLRKEISNILIDGHSSLQFSVLPATGS